ncbi:unnamed protein product [Rotaria socialis]|uniref:Uncharacterized protein n=1 Tax=Rotaria socialis TaxID=392032 RepID=A0A821D4K5_9BILA|nr:unnamed protein product [Rotaria socialis]
MEKQQTRRCSVSSVHSQGNLSIASAQCADTHTHAIIQKEKDKKIILVPLHSFINFGKVVKVHETATYKSDKDSRKTERGKVLLFGTEELCVDQLQVLQEDVINENQPPEKQHDSNPIETSSKKGSSSTTSNKSSNDRSNHQLQNKSKERCALNELSKPKHHSQINENYNRVNALPPMNINTASTIAILPKRKEKSVSEVQRKLFGDDTNMNSKHCYSFEEEGSDEIEEHLTTATATTTTKKSKKCLTEDSSLKQISNINYKRTTSNKKSPSIIPSSPIQNPVAVNHADNNQDNSTEQNKDETNDDTMDERGSFSFKEFKRLQKENINLRQQKTSLENQVNFMKKNYIPMPDINSRSWIVRLAKLFTQQLSANDIATHARHIGISNPKKLLNCIQNRGTHTAREIVRLICSQETLLTKSGKEGVSEEKRQAIRDFVELQHGPIPDHQFNEAIDGVFRQEKLKMRKAQAPAAKAIQKPVEKNQNSNRQQSIDAFYTKKSTLNIQEKDKEVAVVTTSDSDEHF